MIYKRGKNGKRNTKLYYFVYITFHVRIIYNKSFITCDEIVLDRDVSATVDNAGESIASWNADGGQCGRGSCI